MEISGGRVAATVSAAGLVVGIQRHIQVVRNIPARIRHGLGDDGIGLAIAHLGGFEDEVGAAFQPREPRIPWPDGEREFPGKDGDKLIAKTVQFVWINSRVHKRGSGPGNVGQHAGARSLRGRGEQRLEYIEAGRRNSRGKPSDF